jgi:BCD family chlorophyll transporter-like MFS transporter
MAITSEFTFGGGLAVAIGGAIRDIVSHLALQGRFGDALMNASTGYSFVWHVEVYLLFATLIAIGPLVRPVDQFRRITKTKFGLAVLPG